MKKFLSLVLVACLASFLTGCGDDKKSRRSKSSRSSTPDLDDPEVRERILNDAVSVGVLEYRGEEGNKRYYMPRSQKPFTGWMYGKTNGQLRHLTHTKEGMWNGASTGWYQTGEKRFQREFEKGKLVTFITWKPNGQKCPVTNVVDGNGVAIWYDEDGSVGYRFTYRDGESF